jgi:acyl-CoA thioesterase I
MFKESFVMQRAQKSQCLLYGVLVPWVYTLSLILSLFWPLLWAPAATAQSQVHVTASAKAPIQRELLLLAFGDSLTAGYQLGPDESFPAQLQARLRQQGIKARVHNAGVSGDTSTAGRSRLAWVLAGLKTKPDLVILALGANDALQGLDPNKTRANLDAMLAELKKRNIPVLLVGMLAPRNLGRDYARTFDALYPELAKRYQVPLYPFFLEGVALNPALNLADGIHPNKQGIALIVRRMLPNIRAALAI